MFLREKYLSVVQENRLPRDKRRKPFVFKTEQLEVEQFFSCPLLPGSLCQGNAVSYSHDVDTLVHINVLEIC